MSVQKLGVKVIEGSTVSFFTKATRKPRHASYVANSIRFPAVQNFWKSVQIWQSYRDFKGVNFFETECTWLHLILAELQTKLYPKFAHKTAIVIKVIFLCNKYFA